MRTFIEEKIYFCSEHSKLASPMLERYTSQIDNCSICGKQSSFYVVIGDENEIEIPAERLEIINDSRVMDSDYNRIETKRQKPPKELK